MDLTAHIPREQAVPLVELARRRFPQTTQPKLLANTVRQVWERIHLRPPGIVASLVFLALCGTGFLTAPVVLLALMLPTTATSTGIAADGSTVDVREIRSWGSLRESTELDKEGRPHGRHFEFHSNSAKVMIEGSYRNGLPDGTWTEYNEDGQIDSVRHYDQGQLIPPPADA